MVIASDYVRAWPQLIAGYVEAPVTTLGTDGFGRSDTRAALRSFFEVDRFQIVLAALTALRGQPQMQPQTQPQTQEQGEEQGQGQGQGQGQVDAATCARAIARYGIQPEQEASWTC